jgi:acetyltransferase
VGDRYQGRGIGTEMVGRLVGVGRREGLRRIVAVILAENAAMLALAKRFHFAIVPGEDPLSRQATLDLS